LRPAAMGQRALAGKGKNFFKEKEMNLKRKKEEVPSLRPTSA
jgi:hypothetical protein